MLTSDGNAGAVGVTYLSNYSSAHLCSSTKTNQWTSCNFITFCHLKKKKRFEIGILLLLFKPIYQKLMKFKLHSPQEDQ